MHGKIKHFKITFALTNKTKTNNPTNVIILKRLSCFNYNDNDNIISLM